MLFSSAILLILKPSSKLSITLLHTSNDFERLLEELEIKHSYSKKGYPYDNASMESFNAILKSCVQLYD